MMLLGMFMSEKALILLIDAQHRKIACRLA